MTTATSTPPHLDAHVDLPISGMTCASCAARVERELNKVDGVQATVNIATETATVDYDARTGPDELLAAVRAAGYEAQLPHTHATDGAAHDHMAEAGDAETAALLRRTIISGLLALPVLAMAMVPALQFDNWQWLSLLLARPVVLWGAW